MERCFDSFYGPIYGFLSQSEEGHFWHENRFLPHSLVNAQALPRKKNAVIVKRMYNGHHREMAS